MKRLKRILPILILACCVLAMAAIAIFGVRSYWWIDSWWLSRPCWIVESVESNQPIEVVWRREFGLGTVNGRLVIGYWPNGWGSHEPKDPADLAGWKIGHEAWHMSDFQPVYITPDFWGFKIHHRDGGLNIRLPLWLPFVLFLIISLLAARKWRQHHRLRLRQKLGLCLTCGYDLRATPQRCPECGHVPTGPIHTQMLQ